MANIVHANNPFCPQAKPVHYTITKPKSIESILVKQGLLKNGQRQVPFVVQVDGEFVLQNDWGMRLKKDQLLMIVELPAYLQGGGGSNPLKMVLQIALVVAAMYVPGLFALQGMAAGLVSAGIMIAGTFLINALLPDPIVGVAGDNSRLAKDQFLIGSQNNQARIRSPIPVLYGRRRLYPDLAMAPYVEMSGDEMYLYQLFCLTQGKLSIEQICIEKTPISSFNEVNYKVFQPYEPMNFFPDNVYTAPEITDLKLEDFNVDFQWQGGFVVTPSGQRTQLLSVDLSLPRGLVNMDNSSGSLNRHDVLFIIQARKIDDSNSPVGGWFTLSDASIQASTIDPLLRTFYFTVPLGRYEIRAAKRKSLININSRILDELHWVGARSYLLNKMHYGNVTMLAVKIRASNNINNNISRRINVLGTRILPVFNGIDWVEKPTRSIAWAAADVFRNQIYGRRLRDKRINLDELVRLDKTWTDRGDYCDAIFSDDVTTWEAATRIVECGRTKPIYYAGVIDFCRNEKKQLPSAMFTPQNMIKDSFSVEFSFPKSDEADYVIVEYTDPVSWQSKQVECFLPDSKKQKPLTIQMLGITNRQQAWREGIHRAAIQRVQRQFPEFQTEMEGLIPRYGDKLMISHDVPEWGASGVIESIAGNVIQTSDELPWSQNNVIALRGRDGSVQGLYNITKINDFSGQIDGDPYVSDGYFEEPTHYIFGNTETVGMDVIMIGAVPDGDNKVRISCINYSDYPHDVENELEMPIEVLPSEPMQEVLVITWIHVDQTLAENLYQVSCNTARGASRYDFEVYENDAWKGLYSGANSSFIDYLPEGDEVRIRARAVGSYVGNWFVITTSITPPEESKKV